MTPEAVAAVALIVAVLFYLYERERRAADRFEEERDTFMALLVADAHEKTEKDGDRRD